MQGVEIFNLGAAIVGILSGLAVAIGYVLQKQKRKAARLLVENHLKSEKALRVDKGQRSIGHLSANIALSETEIVEAIDRSKLIRKRSIVDKETGRADGLLYEYDGEGSG